MRLTKIVATLGPTSNTVEAIEQLAKLGVNVCRLNFSHGDYATHGKVIENIRTVNSRGYNLGIMLDTKGPEVRTGDVEQKIVIEKGDLVLFTGKKSPKKSDMKTIVVDYDKFADDAPHARCIVIDNGAIEFRVEKITGGNVIAKALDSGTIGSRRHINLPGAHISIPSFTTKDWNDIRFGAEQHVDFIAASFVRTGDDARKLKAFLLKNKSDAMVISKIETPLAVQNIDDIIEASDGIMVARGDLGSEVPFEDVPLIQDEIVAKCRLAAKPVIVATHMLESMIMGPTPTRAEVTDIAHAARLQADSTMLSGETANGKYPFRAVEAMIRVLVRNERIEPHYDLLVTEEHGALVSMDIARRKQALAASVLATELNADAMIVISKHGRTARAVSNCRPLTPIHAFTALPECQRQLMLIWGIVPHVIEFYDNPEKTIEVAIALLKKQKQIKTGQRLVIVSDARAAKAQVMTIQIRQVA